MKKMKEITLRQDFLSSGDDADQVQAAMNDLLVHRLYIEWGLADIQGLNIDGEKVSTELLIERGPESLTNEIVAAIKAELHLSEDERKNF